jgi:hypothetical protein
MLARDKHFNQGTLIDGERLRKVELLALSRSDQLLLILKALFTFIQNKLP